MNETQLCEPAQKLHQGDIIKINRPDNPRHPTIGVIINADCDLENNKLDGVIAYVPIYEFDEYLTKFWLGNYVSQRRKASLSNIAKICKLSPRETEDLAEWLSVELPKVVATKIVKVSLKKTDATTVNSELITLHKCLSSGCNDLEILTYFCEMEKPKHMDTARKMVEDAKKSMGDDHFFISEIIGEKNIGFVIRMRRIYTIEADQCFTSVAEQRANASGIRESAGRIARLTPLYQFKVAQLFANQYSRIGLPTETTKLSGLAIDSLVHQLAGGIQ